MPSSTTDASARLACRLPSRMPREDWSIRNQPVAASTVSAATSVVTTTRNGSERDQGVRRAGGSSARTIMGLRGAPRPGSRPRAP